MTSLQKRKEKEEETCRPATHDKRNERKRRGASRGANKPMRAEVKRPSMWSHHSVSRHPESTRDICDDPHETCKTPKTSRPFFPLAFAPRSFLGLITTSPQCFGTAPAPLSDAVFDDAVEGAVTTTGGSSAAPSRDPEFERGRVARGWR